MASDMGYDAIEDMTDDYYRGMVYLGLMGRFEMGKICRYRMNLEKN